MSEQKVAAQEGDQRTFLPWPAVAPDTVYDYSFSVWPDENSPRMRPNNAVFDLFRHMFARNVMQFTEREFNDFRDELAKVGLTLREIERAPHLDPIGVL